ncbi:TadE/TadG family type IV pilus assembly protein [Novosphingobium sp.]|uniref:TadE/TadG family type IV pilus assembly protein n=1 Tax=Novosphingobium sp. TaxID=1874826 RepID=UPI003BA9C4E6
MPRRSKATGGRFRASMRSLIGSLLRDTAGNTLGIVLATIILLVSLAGSGTDMARAYMTKTSLQNACDAGVLAGRKAMATTGTYGTTETAKANKMFNFNFNPSATNSQSVTFTTDSSGTGAVSGTASTVMPTVIMGIFGFKSITLTVACSAELQMASADVMFVLDTTGSMACNPDGSNCNSSSTSKIIGLRQAIRDFYKTVAAAVVDKTNTRIRFGFVPYTATVNMGGIVAAGQMPTSYFADTQPFQTALANFKTKVFVPTAGSPVATTETYGSSITKSDCDNYGVNAYPSAGGNPVDTGGPAPADTVRTTYSYKSWTKNSGKNATTGTCVRNKSVTTTTYATRYQFTNWTFQAATIDMTAFKGMANVPVVTNISATATVPTEGTYDMPSLAALNGTTGVTGLTTTNAKWDGCIEERKTVQNLAMNPVPSGATDLDIDSVPTDDDTRWKIYENDLLWYRGSTNVASVTSATIPSGYGRENSQCPPRAMLFTDVDTSAPTVVPTWLETYVNTLVASGSTYHDIGMIWGARLASPTGLFQSNVNADPVKFPSVSRHIIFMTDGEMAPTIDSYSAYGEEIYDNRVAPSGTSSTTLKNYHNNRFLAACTKAKNLGYTVWLIGFGTSLTTQMTSCATAGRAYYASDTVALNNTFKFIAGQVADLRINK